MASLGITQIAIVVTVLAAVVALLVLWSIQTSAETRKIQRRIGRVSDRWLDQIEDETGPRSLRRGEGTQMPLLEALTRNLTPRPELLRQRLRQTGLNLNLGNYGAICVGVAVVSGILRSVFFTLPLPLAILLPIVSGLALPHLWVTIKIQRRQKQFIARFPEAIDLIVRGLKSGLPVTESIRVVGEEFDGPVGEEFRNVADRVRLGQPLEDALKETGKQINVPEFQFFIISLSVQRETGGNLSEALENLSDIIRRRRQLKLKIKALSSEAKASAYIIGSLPFIMFVILYVVNAGYVSTLFTDPRGPIMIGVGLGFIVVGAAVMWKMVRFEI